MGIPADKMARGSGGGGGGGIIWGVGDYLNISDKGGDYSRSRKAINRGTAIIGGNTVFEIDFLRRQICERSKRQGNRRKRQEEKFYHPAFFYILRTLNHRK